MVCRCLHGMHQALLIWKHSYSRTYECDGTCHLLLSKFTGTEQQLECCADDLSLPTPPRVASPAPAPTELDDLQERFAALKRR